MRKQVQAWQKSELTDVTAQVVIYEAFVEGKLDAPKHLARIVHDHYFEPKYEQFRPRTIWSLSNAFTLAFKELDPIPQFKATAKFGVPRGSVLGVVLAWGGTRRTAASVLADWAVSPFQCLRGSIRLVVEFDREGLVSNL
jgi:hypothetical protein